MANNQQFNPLTAPLSAIKQMGEQVNLGIQSVGGGLATAASQGLDALMQAAPALPGVPGAPAANKGVPTPQQLLPANLTQALGQVESLLIPPGLPRPSQMMAQTPAPTQTPTPQPTPQPTARAARVRVAERRGL